MKVKSFRQRPMAKKHLESNPTLLAFLVTMELKWLLQWNRDKNVCDALCLDHPSEVRHFLPSTPTVSINLIRSLPAQKHVNSEMFAYTSLAVSLPMRGAKDKYSAAKQNDILFTLLATQIAFPTIVSCEMIFTLLGHSDEKRLADWHDRRCVRNKGEYGRCNIASTLFSVPPAKNIIFASKNEH